MKYEQIMDSEGLQRAYHHGDYYLHGKTMFIAGSHTEQDWFDDFTKILFLGNPRNSDKYQQILEERKIEVKLAP